MELLGLLPTIPVPMIVALLAGIFFLHRAWGSSLLSTKVLQTESKLPTEDIATQTQTPDPASDESTAQAVSKESDFPANWWAGKGIFELERRAVFSKVPPPHRPNPDSNKPSNKHTDMALHLAPQPLHQARRLPLLRSSWVPGLPDHGERPAGEGLPQRVPPQSVHGDAARRRVLDRAGLQVPRLELQYIRASGEGAAFR